MNTTNADYFTFNAHNTMLLIGQSGCGKSYLVHKLVDRYIQSHTPDELKFAIFDLKQVEFVTPEDINPEYLLFNVVLDPTSGLDKLDELTRMAQNRVAENTTNPLIFVYIEENDMAHLDPTRFENAMVDLNLIAKEANVKVIYSTSSPSPESVSDKLVESFELILSGTITSGDAERLEINKGVNNLEKFSFSVKEKLSVH